MQTPEDISDINVIILGAEGVGKSTFIEKALDIPQSAASRAAERKIAVKGTEADYIVRLLEVSIEDVDWDDDDGTVIWPETIDDKMMPRIDGALVLYDIKDASSLGNVPDMLSKCSREKGSRYTSSQPLRPGNVLQLLLTLTLYRGNS